MSESYAEFAEADGSVRMAGELLYPTATVGDVLTVQSDGSIAAAAGGGGIPDSWLAVFADAGLTASGNLTFDLGANAGTDIVIDGMDATKINIVTPGYYAIWFQFDFVGDATGAGLGQGQLGGDITGIDWLASGDDLPACQETVIPASYQSKRSFTTPPIHVAAPTTIQAGVFIEASAGTITVGAGFSGLVHRLA